MGRGTWLFADTPDGGHAIAIFFTSLNTAKENGLNPTEYMVRVLSEVGKADDMKNLLPFA